MGTCGCHVMGCLPHILNSTGLDTVWAPDPCSRVCVFTQKNFDNLGISNNTCIMKWLPPKFAPYKWRSSRVQQHFHNAHFTSRSSDVYNATAGGVAGGINARAGYSS